MAQSTSSLRDADWARRYASRLFYSDALVVVATLLAYGWIAFEHLAQPASWQGGPAISYAAILCIVGVIWMVCLDIVDSRDRHTIGHGIIEYRRIVNATILVFGTVVAAAFFLRIDIARSLFIIAMPVGLVALLLSRWMWRQWLREQQRRGAYVYRAVVVGERSKAAHIARQIQRTPGSGFVIIGAVSSPGDGMIGEVPVIGDFQDAGAAVIRAGADTLILASADALDPQAMRRLGWEMADHEINWVVAPTVTDVAGPRIHSRPVAGLPLVHIDFPSLEGFNRVAKRTFDLVGGALLLVVLSPIMVATAVAIFVESGGAVLYRQARVGRAGKEFGMLKFRSMITNADDELESLLDQQGTSNRPLFKVIDDPRITPVGRVIRKYSIDELPQLFNVLRGDMSLVGPRPQRAAEVALYDDDAHRRIRVKPGMSGLWQVSGRSTLTWEDSIRLDLYYVENWSFTQDMQILFRTFRAVIAPGDTAR